MGWLFTGYTKGLGKYSADLWADPAIVRADQQFIFWVLAGLIFPGIVAGLISRSLSGVLLGFLWGGLGARPARAPHHLERQFGLPSLGQSTLWKPGPEPK